MLQLPKDVETIRTGFATTFTWDYGFSKIVPNVRKLGLLDGWLRTRFAELGILQYEDLEASDVEALAAEPAAAVAH